MPEVRWGTCEPICGGLGAGRARSAAADHGQDARLWITLCVVLIWAAALVGTADLAAQVADEEYVEPLLEQALETEKTNVELSWSNPDTGSSGIIVIERTFYRDPSTPCRDYRRTLERAGAPPVEIRGTGCRVGPNEWELDEEGPASLAATPAPGAGPAPGLVRPRRRTSRSFRSRRALRPPRPAAPRSASLRCRAASHPRWSTTPCRPGPSCRRAVATIGSTLDPKSNHAVKTPAGSLLANRYRLDVGIRRGRGCFEATDRTTGERVLVKLGPRGGTQPREAELLARLDHPSIVRLKDSGRDGDLTFVVLEWVDGGDLEAFMASSGGAIADDRLIQLLCAARRCRGGHPRRRLAASRPQAGKRPAAVGRHPRAGGLRRRAADRRER